MIYIYLNTYENGYLYVGIHRWSGEGIDPNYYGSSSIARNFGWKPKKIEILEVLEKREDLVKERFWIEKYAEIYGISDCVFRRNKWTEKYKRHGLLLNGHSNSAEQMMSVEVQNKAIRTRKNDKVLQDKLRKKIKIIQQVGNCFSVEAQIKRIRTVRENGTKSYDEGVYEERRKTREIRNKEKSYGKMKLVRVSKGEFRKEGVLHRLCVELGHPTWDTSISKKFRDSNVCEHRGYKFEWLNKEYGYKEKDLRTEKERRHDGCLKAIETKRKNARHCKLQDGFIGNTPDIVLHTGLKKGTVSTAIKLALERGEYKTKSGWIFSRIN